ncbi:uncharacterized protein MKK02DRAFT_30581 [Dioszegia hungarica]|uniref:Uncharacterized protein n=1 Tax=Dioszegia hungarica TaxID=4972 RepID=A0AA38H282_9TREE|nr:uncharacterized protein MKK02DRAFT_30581 [Dioszegia hungarica]KAI9632853.1 hypothetical protein MKK02DRAFT_30581 [Dioszegia hungarica]
MYHSDICIILSPRQCEGTGTGKDGDVERATSAHQPPETSPIQRLHSQATSNTKYPGEMVPSDPLILVFVGGYLERSQGSHVMVLGLATCETVVHDVHPRKVSSLLYLVPLLGLILPATAVPDKVDVAMPAGTIGVFTGQPMGNPALSFEYGGVAHGQKFLELNRKGPDSFLLVNYTSWSWPDHDEEEHKKLQAGGGTFSLHKKVEGKADEQLNCDLDGDFKDPTKGVFWAFTWDEVKGVETQICPEESNGITLKCKGETDFKPRCRRF